VQQKGGRVGHRLEQRQRTGDRHAAGEQVGDAEGDGEVHDGEGAGLRQAVCEGNSHRSSLIENRSRYGMGSNAGVH